MPDRLPEKPQVVWRAALGGKGLAGLAATPKVVLVAARDITDKLDVFHCLDAATGAPLWTVRQLAPGRLDYGNSPRATPLIHDELVFLGGALGHFHCVELATGKIIWQKDFRAEFGDVELAWGLCASPLIAGGKLILRPGAPQASLVALEPSTGKVLWKTPGGPPGYGSLIAGEFGGRQQIVGHDVDSLGGWDIETGLRLWRLVPPTTNDFNVPTPIAYRGQILVTTENNGARLYRFDSQGAVDRTPVAVNVNLNPDTHTPVAVGDRLFGVAGGKLYCLDLADKLKPIWIKEDSIFDEHVNLIATDDRLLVSTSDGDLLLLTTRANSYQVLSRVKVLDDERGNYSHPALVGRRLFWRGSAGVICVALD